MNIEEEDDKEQERKDDDDEEEDAKEIPGIFFGTKNFFRGQRSRFQEKFILLVGCFRSQTTFKKSETVYFIVRFQAY